MQLAGNRPKWPHHDRSRHTIPALRHGATGLVGILPGRRSTLMRTTSCCPFVRHLEYWAPRTTRRLQFWRTISPLLSQTTTMALADQQTLGKTIRARHAVHEPRRTSAITNGIQVIPICSPIRAGGSISARKAVSSTGLVIWFNSLPGPTIDALRLAWARRCSASCCWSTTSSGITASWVETDRTDFRQSGRRTFCPKLVPVCMVVYRVRTGAGRARRKCWSQPFEWDSSMELGWLVVAYAVMGMAFALVVVGLGVFKRRNGISRHRNR